MTGDFELHRNEKLPPRTPPDDITQEKVDAQEHVCTGEPPSLVPPDDITVHPIGRNVADVKVLPGAEAYPASPTLQQLSGVGARMPEVVKRLRSLRYDEVVLRGSDVRRRHNLYAQIKEIIKFAETGK